MYDLNQPHKRLVSKGQTALILQNGLVFEHGSRKCLGKVLDLKDRLVGKSGNECCVHCGGTFTGGASFEEHLLKIHRDLLVSIASRRAPKGLKGNWSPSEEMLKEEAVKLSGGKQASPEEETTEEESSQGQKTKGKGWREPANR